MWTYELVMLTPELWLIDDIPVKVKHSTFKDLGIKTDQLTNGVTPDDWSLTFSGEGLETLQADDQDYFADENGKVPFVEYKNGIRGIHNIVISGGVNNGVNQKKQSFSFSFGPIQNKCKDVKGGQVCDNLELSFKDKCITTNVSCDDTPKPDAAVGKNFVVSTKDCSNNKCSVYFKPEKPGKGKYLKSLKTGDKVKIIYADLKSKNEFIKQAPWKKEYYEDNKGKWHLVEYEPGKYGWLHENMGKVE